MDAVNNMARGNSERRTECNKILPNGHTHINGETNRSAELSTPTKKVSVKVDLQLSGHIKDLIQKFSSGESGQHCSAGSSSRSLIAGASSRNSTEKISQSEVMEGKGTPERIISVLSRSDSGKPNEEGSLPTITVTSPSEDPFSNSRDIQESDSQCSEISTDATSERIISQLGNNLGNGSVEETVVESDFVLEIPPSGEELLSFQAKLSPNYQLSLSSDMLGNDSRDPDRKLGEDSTSVCSEGHSSKHWPSHHSSLESLTSQDWDTISERMAVTESPSRVFRSPYKSLSTETYPVYRMSESKGLVSPATSDFGIFSLNSRSTSLVPSPTLSISRGGYTVYRTLTKKHEVIPNGFLLKSGVHSKCNYIAELTGQLDESQRRNRFLEAERVQMDKERNQIRFEMRGLLVQNEDLLWTNAQLQLEMKGVMDRMAELERERTSMNLSLRQLETEITEAKEVMVEATTQQYAFNYLQQSLKEKIQDTKDTLEKQTQDCHLLSEKLWHTERKLEELNMEKQAQEKKAVELDSTVQRLEAELVVALQASSQAAAELSLQKKLRADALQRVEQLEDSLMKKTQELQRAQQTVTRLQGEVSDRLTDKERALEEEIKRCEWAQLQCKQAERKAKDLQAELHTLTQSKQDTVKQLKQAQENIADMESNLEDMHDSEERWANKHKKAVEQVEQFQQKLIQEKDLNDHLNREKGRLERQVRDLHVEAQELKESRVQEDMLTKAELRVKELEDTVKTEERKKVVLVNTIGKLERKIKQLSDQMEEEHQATTQHNAQMTQRIRSLKCALNEAEEVASRTEAQQRQTQREVQEERETSARLQRQLLDLHLQTKQKESLIMRKTLTNQKRMISC
ncbi:cingulin-like protein 1 isoform X2 [Megalops cyprinoides]|uniref:cingulin-like protein 1 isoform X2 n=1 Tax=Megalops cyprinoides TaxID=118141 RepID=UPI001863BE68|nr:cingulin-like protein 1 isoform X2 [Megalops cyprinoides]